MTTLMRAHAWKISVYGREHGMAHVHVSGAGFRAALDIETGAVLAGKLPADILREARRWLAQHRAEAQRQWDIHNPES